MEPTVDRIGSPSLAQKFGRSPPLAAQVRDRQGQIDASEIQTA